MWLNRLFADSKVNFAGRCRGRMKAGAIMVILGVVTMGMTTFFGEKMPVIYMEKSYSMEFISGYYRTMGVALMAAGAAMILKNMRLLKQPELLKKREVAELDERNRLLGLRCWAYTGYSMFLILYVVGILAGGFISMTVMVVLQAVIVVYAAMLLLFRILLSRCM